MSNSAPDRVLADLFREIRSRLDQLPSESFARAAGFLKRKPRKILVAALVALGAETVLSLERIATVIGLAAGVSYSKQALHDRLSSKIEGFLIRVATALLQHTVATGAGPVLFRGSSSKTARASPCRNGWPKPFRAVAINAGANAAF